MKPEMLWLTATIFMTALLWLPYILNRIAVRGLWVAISDRGPENGPHSLWGERAIKAHRNAVENLVIFAPLVLIAHAQGLSSPLLAGAAAVYFFARLAHFLVYTAGLPVVRTLSFAVGWVAQMIFVFAIFGWV
jgi:uncharacterized MAPEG superfamily protein